MSILRRWADPFMVGIVGMMILGLVLPIPDGAVGPIQRVSDVGIFILFLLYGARLSTREVIDGMRNIRLQGSILAATFVVFPLFGWALHHATTSLLGPGLAAGLLYVSLLPSTVQSSVAFVSVARGNIAGAICAATVSNVAGMVLTPLLVLWLMGASGSVGAGGITEVLVLLLLPFVIGQIAQRWVGPWVRRHKRLTGMWDKLTILLIVFVAVVTATAAGVWTSVSGWSIVAVGGISIVFVALMLALTWWGGKLLGLDIPDRIALLMCGSKKSMATGLPMASVLFTPAVAGPIAVPLIIFHQLQLMICAWLARRLARREDDAPLVSV
ncbi:bile acid:sodium symporter [Pseudactinotalea sp. HY160]|uniref:bile acid:sodium symporter family protein n=1 Tax=Pseudactinotalea sp. HY160 TaxID=2654490 RepID=UPI00128CE0C3|nr:bile acid:sodium symporter family protein [Pseudactinotalea sp. HY160]MPV49029.1 bile acid:sodium symporter [Pseudactinotalea sp. HY160]